MDNAQVVQLVAKLRRAMPRHDDVLSLCEWVESKVAVSAVSSSSKEAGPKRDRASYMRDYRAGKRKRA